ncbi:unnamed protein product [Nesidiocoris tenuis]|uniref:Uncharacterized protein n=1 Tax=Nesidiocoris tenuis TaxID=355587 RepID=A0A6H5GJQ0_9HEMI|nr:unnamed protein product [Nesidiocoris tenuis]
MEFILILGREDADGEATFRWEVGYPAPLRTLTSCPEDVMPVLRGQKRPIMRYMCEYKSFSRAACVPCPQGPVYIQDECFRIAPNPLEGFPASIFGHRDCAWDTTAACDFGTNGQLIAISRMLGSYSRTNDDANSSSQHKMMSDDYAELDVEILKVLLLQQLNHEKYNLINRRNVEERHNHCATEDCQYRFPATTYDSLLNVTTPWYFHNMSRSAVIQEGRSWARLASQEIALPAGSGSPGHLGLFEYELYIIRPSRLPGHFCHLIFSSLAPFYWRTHEFLSFEKRRKRSLQTFRQFAKKEHYERLFSDRLKTLRSSTADLKLHENVRGAGLFSDGPLLQQLLENEIPPLIGSIRSSTGQKCNKLRTFEKKASSRLTAIGSTGNNANAFRTNCNRGRNRNEGTAGVNTSWREKSKTGVKVQRFF